MFSRPWAFWRRTQYIAGLFVFLALLSTAAYFSFFYESATCFDNARNGDERGIDCGGSCTRICVPDVFLPTSLWAHAFRVTDGQYNAVAYIQNVNKEAGSPEVTYTFSFYDAAGLITERSGTTVLPPDSVYPIFEGRINTGGRVPTETRIVIAPPSLWLPASAGREQFVVENRELKAADTSPRLEASVRNTAITEAKDVEIVATIFDSRGNPLTASRTIVPIFPAESLQQVTFTWPEPIAKTIRSCEVPTDVVLAIDLSGSMNNDGGAPPQPVTSVLKAAEAFVDRLSSNDQISLVTYATNAVIVEPLTKDKAKVRERISALTIDPKEERGNTNTGDALIQATAEIESVRHSSDARKVVVLLTDGLATAPAKDPETHALTAAEKLKANGTEVFAIGLGEDLNEAFLSSIATDANHYFKAGTTDTVDHIYRSVTEAICEDGAAVIEIVPKTSASFAPLQ